MNTTEQPVVAKPIRPRERDAVLHSLRAGLVPRTGGHLIQVGRQKEMKSLLGDIERVKDGGSSFRFVSGRYGCGKSFLLSLYRALALQQKLVVLSADMSTTRRFHSHNGEARALYAELVSKLATKSCPDGGALPNLCEGWISQVKTEVIATGGNDADVSKRIMTDLKELQQYVGGFEFAEVLSRYHEGYVSGNETLQGNALRWIRGEYTTKTEAYSDLGVRRIIDDSSWYDALKLLALFARKAGYGGVVVCLDELAVYTKAAFNGKSRMSNFEVLLTMFNDCMQGTVKGLGFILAGTTDFITNPRTGLYSYEALKTRLSASEFAKNGMVDLSGPVIALSSLTPEDFYVLLENILTVHASGDRTKWIAPPECIRAVLEKSNEVLGSEFFKSPRDVVRSFVGLLGILDDNPGTTWQSLIGGDFLKQAAAANPDGLTEESSEQNAAVPKEIGEFKL